MIGLLERLKQYLGIRSPSRVFADLDWHRVEIDRKAWPPYAPSAPVPWYAARHPLDAHESPDVRAAARRVRRLIRRHWFALFFEPQSPIALSVRAAMQTPPKTPERSSFDDACAAMQKLDEFRRLISSGQIDIRPDVIDEFATRCGVRWEGEP